VDYLIDQRIGTMLNAFAVSMSLSEFERFTQHVRGEYDKGVTITQAEIQTSEEPLPAKAPIDAPDNVFYKKREDLGKLNAADKAAMFQRAMILKILRPKIKAAENQMPASISPDFSPKPKMKTPAISPNQSITSQMFKKSDLLKTTYKGKFGIALPPISMADTVQPEKLADTIKSSNSVEPWLKTILDEGREFVKKKDLNKKFAKMKTPGQATK
jgi:hypothetical protein